MPAYDVWMEESAVASAANAATWWSETTIAERTSRLTALAGALSQRSGAFQHLITSEVARTLRESCAEVLKCAAYARWLAANGAHTLAPRPAAGARIHFRPAGIVAGIMPWNFPFWQVFRFAAAALVGGNAVIVKHSPLVPRCAAALTELFAAAGFDRGVFFCESGPAQSARKLIADDRVRAIAFTGSSETGRKVAELAGRHLKKCVLELGGSDAFIVMPTANLRDAVRAAVQSRMRASGQACTAAKRFIVHVAVAEEFEARLAAAFDALKTGDPFDPSTDVGPLINEAATDRLERQVRVSIADGAELLYGGERLSPRVFQPTILRASTVTVPVMQEETFGPVAPILRVRDVDEAIEMSNRSRFGLSASVWSTDEDELASFRSRLDVGQLFVNTAASSRIDLPFGGTKDSGFGRELGDAGVYEFVNVKTEIRA